LGGVAIGMAIVVGGKVARADALEVVVPGGAATGFRSRTSTDDSLRESLDVASLVATEPGVHVRRLGGDESFASLSIRGAASSQVGVVLFGIPLSGAADPSLDVGSLPLFSGAGVRVFRSFVPATLGTSGHLGGVLVLDAPSFARGARTESFVALGCFGSQKLRISDARRVGDTFIASSLGASRSDGDFDYFADDPSHPAGGVMRPRQNNGHVAVSGIERIETELGHSRIGFTLLGQVRQQGLPGPSRYATRFARLDTSRVGGGADWILRTGNPDSEDGVGIGAFRFAGYGIFEGSRFRDPDGEIDPTRRDVGTDDLLRIVGGSASWRGIVAKGLVVDGVVDARNESWQPGEQGRTARSPEASRTSLGLGGDAEVALSEKVKFAGTVRSDLIRDRVSGAASETPWLLIGHVGVDYAIAPWLSLASHVGALARPPSFVELYGDRGAVTGNADLEPERATTFDAGFRGRVRTGGVRLGYEASGFLTEARSLIAFVPYGRSALRAENLDRARLVGAEVALSFEGGPSLSRVGYTAMLTRNEGDDALARGKPLPGRPAHDLAFDTTWTFHPLRLRYSLDVVAGTTLDPKATLLLPPRALHGLGATVELTQRPRLVVGARADNVFDARVAHITSPATGHDVPQPISDLLGYPLPGRSFWLTAKVSVD